MSGQILLYCSDWAFRGNVLILPAAVRLQCNFQFVKIGAASNGEHYLNSVQRAVLLLRERVCRQQVPHLIPHFDRFGHHVHLVTVHPGIVFILQASGSRCSRRP